MSGTTSIYVDIPQSDITISAATRQRVRLMGYHAKGRKMVSRDLVGGFRAVPYDAVTRNGIPIPRLNTMAEPYSGYWALIAPNGRAVDNESGGAYCYSDIEEASQDAEVLVRLGDYSTCR